VIEIHGKRDCPFAWRVRIAANEKGLPFDWIPCDVPRPDPRAMENNPEQKSPKLVEDGFELTESLVILGYLDEAYPGRPLQALGARGRAQMRLRLRQLAKLEVLVGPGHPVDEKVRARAAEGHQALEQMLSDGRAFLGGLQPDLSDVAAWPFVSQLEEAGLPIPAPCPKAAAWWQRARGRQSLVATRPASP
jgi:glutathione S-transferase